jgi:predicted TIM-barrel fold metal-dependent hydrolase
VGDRSGKPRRIDKAFIQPAEGNTLYTWTDGTRTGRDAIRAYMDYTVELVQKYPDRFLGCFVYNPRYGTENGALEIERHAKEFGFKMVQLHANLHAYRPDRAKDWLRPALKKCAELGLLVRLHTGDGPYSIPTSGCDHPRVPTINFSWHTSACRPAACTASSRSRWR